MNALLKIALAVAAMAFATQAAAKITFYENEGFTGKSIAAEERLENFAYYGFNDRASSVEVLGERWEVCQDAGFNGRCMILRPGRYPSLAAMGLNDRVSSARAISNNANIDDSRYAPAPVSAQATFYEGQGFQGKSFSTTQQIDNLNRYGFNDRASSVEITGDRWEVCEGARFDGRCVVLRPGRYPSLAAMGLNDRVSSVRVLAWNARIDDNRYAPAPVAAQATFYEGQGFQGKSFIATQQIDNLNRYGFNDRASSVEVVGDRWEVCEDARFGGRCAVLRPGRYPSLAAMGLNDRISSVRIVDWNANVNDGRYAPTPVTDRDYRRRNNERLYEANVTSVRAVVGTPEQRCWVEREQVAQEQAKVNVPVAIAGAIIGGILGHQIGGGRGKDIATAGGAVAGAVVGSQIGRGGGTKEQDVQRCENVPSQAKPDYWDVTYNFRGQDHNVQMTSAPGPTVTVNSEGEPRS
jgi:uncharacterized protein YcfJ